MRIGVLTFPGSTSARDALRAIAYSGGEPVELWYEDEGIDQVDALVIPGGSSYGDYLRAGAIAAMDPVLRTVSNLAETGTPILGIGNGFQILAAAEILPGTFAPNLGQKFVRTDQRVRISSNTSVWTRDFAVDEEIVLPLRVKHGCYLTDEDTVAILEGQGRIVARYEGANPTGSTASIAGVSNERGNVVGILPHPEFAVEAGFGPDTSEAMRSGIDGARFFDSVLQSFTPTH